VYELLTFQGVTDTLEALLRDKVYAAMMFTSLGIPMLWQGMEFGEPRGWHNDSEKLSYRPIQWWRKSTNLGKWHFQWYKALVYQRRFNPALYDGELRKLYRYDAERTLVWGMEDTSSASQVMIVANLSGSEQTLNDVPWLSAGTWYEIVNQTPFAVPATPVASITIPRYTALIYANKTNSELNIPVSVENKEEQSTPPSFFLSANYPNPFNPTTTFQYSLPRNARVRMAVYNVIGELVTVLVDRDQSPGIYIVQWNGSSSAGSAVSSGIYLARFSTESYSETRKLVLIR